MMSDDPDSEVAVAIRERGGYQLMPEWGTKPANHYLPRRKASITIHEDELVRADNPLNKERRSSHARRQRSNARRDDELVEVNFEVLTMHPAIFNHLSHHPDRRRPGFVSCALYRTTVFGLQSVAGTGPGAVLCTWAACSHWVCWCWPV